MKLNQPCLQQGRTRIKKKPCEYYILFQYLMFDKIQT